jgi:Zn-finger nucleic acid-binding protein
MKQINRYGIEIDVCPTTGGVWLDKGELEKLMAIIREAVEEEQGSGGFAPPPSRSVPAGHYQQPVHHAPPQHYGHKKRDYDDDDDDYKYRGYGGKPYKKSKMSKILDIFDF